MLHSRLTSIPPTVAIIGGGFSGTMVAVQLLRQATTPLQIKLIERRSEIGRGAAYSTGCDAHLLNVPAGKISAFPDQPHHFLDWLRQQPGFAAAAPDWFVPRRIYGAYLQAVLTETQNPVAQLDHLHDEVTAVYAAPQGAIVQLKSGAVLLVDRVVLALGNLPAADPPIADRSFYSNHRYISNPWSSEALAAVDFTQPILLIGSGLTMVDWALTLHQHEFRHRIYAVSRRGLLPQAHLSHAIQPASISPYSLSSPIPQTGRSILHWLRQEVKLAQQQGTDWRTVIDALRPHTQTLWQALSLTEQRRFLRHLRPYWEVHRHRIGPPASKVIDQLQQGQLQIQAGRIIAYREQSHSVEVWLRPRHSPAPICLQVGTVINCTGAASDYQTCDHPLIKALLQTGLATSDPLGLGLTTAASGALIQANGETSDRLFTLGPALKGKLWETTAVPELRQQAVTLAQTLLQLHQLSVSDSYQISRSRSFKYSNAV
jgi:uncharacterized NAD(P)/FAD-binding protein YdhS